MCEGRTGTNLDQSSRKLTRISYCFIVFFINRTPCVSRIEEEKLLFDFSFSFPREKIGRIAIRVAIFQCHFFSTSACLSHREKGYFPCCQRALSLCFCFVAPSTSDEENFVFLCCLCLFYIFSVSWENLVIITNHRSQRSVLKLIFDFGCQLCDLYRQTSGEKRPLLLYNFTKERARREEKRKEGGNDIQGAPVNTPGSMLLFQLLLLLSLPLDRKIAWKIVKKKSKSCYASDGESRFLFCFVMSLLNCPFYDLKFCIFFQFVDIWSLFKRDKKKIAIFRNVFRSSLEEQWCRVCRIVKRRSLLENRFRKHTQQCWSQESASPSCEEDEIEGRKAVKKEANRQAKENLSIFFPQECSSLLFSEKV